MDFNSSFNEETWTTHLGEHFIKEDRPVNSLPIIKDKFNFLVSIKSFGTLFKNEEDNYKSLPIYIVSIKDTKDTTRIKITRMLYEIINEDIHRGSALFFILYENKNTYRFSYVKVSRKIGHDGIKNVKSDPKRYTYLLGEDIKTHTAKTRLRESMFTSTENIEAAFSVEPVNKEFYKGIYEYFNKIFNNIKSSFESEKKAKEFSLRFIGRIVFCWFLKEKDLIDKDFLGSGYLEKNKTINYYDEMLSILFFEILNRDMNERTIKNSEIDNYAKGIPFLNGGLFSKNDDDYIKNGVVKNETIKELFLFLEMYNFTVDESTPVDIEVSIDPEMLGRIFENLLADISPVTEVSARKETGAFYTPREIVDYMVVESIKTYIKKTCCPNVSEDKIDELFLLSGDTVYTTHEKKEILSCVHKMKILDPACGSGAFPMGGLQRIFMLINRLDPENEYYRDSIISSDANSHARKEFEKIFEAKKFSYGYKLQILKSMIYSVDIEPIAIEIARLRAFLSLIVEENKDLTDSDNFGIKPLPNLEFQFIIANSLVGLFNENSTLSGYNLRDNYIAQISGISKLFFEADSSDKKAIVENKFEAFRHYLKNSNVDDDFFTQEVKDKLLSWNPFKNISCDFFEPHIQFGIDKDTNFDIVIGNPPYIQLQSMDKNITQKYINEKYNSYKSTGDIYQLFFEKSFNLLSPKGVTSLITSNKWMRAGYGEFTRRFFMNNACVHKVIDLGSGRFESATVDTSIIFYGKKNSNTYNKEYSINAVNFKLGLDELKNINAHGNQSIKLTSDAWIILSDTESLILAKMILMGKPLKDWDISINRGVITGFNEAFIIDTATKDALIAEDSKCAEIIKPLLRGRDIKRYSYQFADKWLINTHNGLKNKNIKPIDIDNYPAIKKHLDKYSKEINKRQDKGDTPYNLRNCAYLADFEKPKIAWQRITDRNKFVISPPQQYILDSMAFFSGFTETEGLYLLGVVNSSTIYYWVKHNVHEYGSTGFRLANQYVEIFPIPVPTKEQETQITALVVAILAKKQAGLDSTDEELQIDALVYALYGLTQEEIKIVEGGL